MFFSFKWALSEFIFFKSLQKAAARLRASAHQETIRLQKQGGPSAPYQNPNSDEEGEAVENHDQGGRGGECGDHWVSVLLSFTEDNAKAFAPVSVRTTFSTWKVGWENKAPP